MSGKTVDAAEALRVGPVNRDVPAEELRSATEELAGRIARNARLPISLPQHEASRRALEAAINDERPLGLTWVVVDAFFRLTTKPGLFERPLAIGDAWDLVDDWLAHPGVRVVQETEEHPRLWSELLRSTGTAGDLTTDAWIATIALANGASVLTLDSDFARFPGLRWESPLGS